MVSAEIIFQVLNLKCTHRLLDISSITIYEFWIKSLKIIINDYLSYNISKWITKIITLNDRIDSIGSIHSKMFVLMNDVPVQWSSSILISSLMNRNYEKARFPWPLLMVIWLAKMKIFQASIPILGADDFNQYCSLVVEAFSLNLCVLCM